MATKTNLFIKFDNVLVWITSYDLDFDFNFKLYIGPTSLLKGQNATQNQF